MRETVKKAPAPRAPRLARYPVVGCRCGGRPARYLRPDTGAQVCGSCLPAGFRRG